MVQLIFAPFRGRRQKGTRVHDLLKGNAVGIGDGIGQTGHDVMLQGQGPSAEQVGNCDTICSVICVYNAVCHNPLNIILVELTTGCIPSSAECNVL
jgi:hypothetical protein